MAERRRRKCNVNENSDDSEDSADEQPINNTSNQGSDAGNSEYESVDEEELAEDEEAVDGEERVVAPPTAEDAEDLKLDHDEDRKNPQYIPKKGTFYEHDDRTMGEGEETIPDNVSEKSAPQEKEAKKKVWKEDGKWQHDRFSAYDQSPKSREELVATYGYDIRNEEGPPRARRRRRYGRGPNKYTRNWEDMDAYSKPTRGGKVEGRGGVGGKGRGRKNTLTSNEAEEEEYPALSVHNREEKEEPVQDHHKEVPVQSTQIDSPKMINTPNAISESYENIKVNKNISGVGEHGSSRVYIDDQRRDTRGTGRGSRPNRKSRPGSKGIPRNHNYSEGGQYMNKNRMDVGRGRGEEKPRMVNRGGHTQAQVSHMQQIYQSQDVQDVTEELKSVTITPSIHKDDHHYKKKNIDTRRTTIPPRLQESMRGNKSGVNHGGDVNSVSKPKRYSSQRQRPMPDQMGQYHHPQGYYDQTGAEPDYNKMYERANSSPGTGTPSQIALPTHAPPPAFVAPSFTTTSTNAFPPAPRLFPTATAQPHLIGPPVAGPPIAPPVAGPGVSGPPVPGTVGGPPVTGPPFLPPENMINYAAGPPALVAAPHPPQFPAFQAFTPVSQQQPQEIYSNGVTYYNTQSQQHLPRINPVLQKRPKAAIPIVPPPDKQVPSREDVIDYGHMRETSDSGNESSAVQYSDERGASDSYNESISVQYSDDRETSETYNESTQVQYSDEMESSETYNESTQVEYSDDREASDSYNESTDIQYSDDYVPETCDESTTVQYSDEYVSENSTLDQEFSKSEERIDNGDITLSPSCTSESNLETSEQSPQISPTTTEEVENILEKVVLEDAEISCKTEELEKINEPNIQLINGEDKNSSSPDTEKKDTTQLEEKSISNIEKNTSDITTERESEVTNSPLDTT